MGQITELKCCKLLALPNWDPSSSANFSSCELLPFGDTAIIANVLLVGFGPLLLNVILWEVCLPWGSQMPSRAPMCWWDTRWVYYLIVLVWAAQGVLCF